MPAASINRKSDVQNNVECAEKIFAEYGDFIRTVIRYKVGNNSQVDDLFQDFFLSLVSRPPPADVQNIKNYLYKVLTNDIIDATRRVEKYKARMHKYAEHHNYPINKNTPANVSIDIEETLKIFELIERRLPQSEAKAVTLRYKDNYNVKEVAAKMDVNVRTVSRYISAGLSKIRRFLTLNQGNINGRA